MRIMRSWQLQNQQQQQCPLSWPAGAGNFCFNLLLPFLVIVCIMFSSHLVPDIYFRTLPTISYSITSSIWELVSQQMAWPCHHIQLWIIISLIFTATPILSWRTTVDTLSTSLSLHNLIIQGSTPCNFASSTTLHSQISQQYSKRIQLQSTTFLPK